mmetsp:Transcript_22153/g.69299  ORF Transcript_22153/g.69299 Transcript_22153/m.69299 type:complete len:468 (-) Transcript_22153:436-1839(-)
MKTSLVALASTLKVGSAVLLEASFDFNAIGEGVVIDEVSGADTFGDTIPGTAVWYGETDEFSTPGRKSAYDKTNAVYGARRDGIIDESITPEDTNNVFITFDSTCSLGLTDPDDEIDPGSPDQCTGDFDRPNEDDPDSDLFRPASRMVGILHNNDKGRESADFIDYSADPPRTENPNDDKRGGCIFGRFDDFCYGGGIDILSIAFLDIDEDPRDLSIRCISDGVTPDYTNSDQFLDVESEGFLVPFNGGDGSYNIVDVSGLCENAQVLEVCMPSSGAIDDIRFTCDTRDCVDDPKWYYKNKWGRKKYCSWFANRKSQCDDFESPYGVPASEGCKRTCGECGFKEFCVWDRKCDTADDDPGFKGGCHWVWSKKTCKNIAAVTDYSWKKYYCNNLYDYKLGKYAYQACPGTCSDECIWKGEKGDEDEDEDKDGGDEDEDKDGGKDGGDEDEDKDGGKDGGDEDEGKDGD